MYLLLLQCRGIDDLPPPDILQQEIIGHLEGALTSFRDVAVALRGPRF